MLKLNNVTKIFNADTCDEKKAINNLSIDIKDGDFVTIIGSNGAGKSTLFNLISGNCDVDTGSIELDGIEITNVSEYKRAKYIGRLFQDPMKGTCPSLTIDENLGLAYLQSYNRGLFSALKKQDKDFIKLKLALLGMGCGIIISALTTKYRDLAVLVTFGVQLWMYGSAIIFPVSSLPEKWAHLLMLNPIVPIVEAFRYAYTGHGTFSVKYLGISAIVTLVILFVGIVIFNKVEKTFMDTV